MFFNKVIIKLIFFLYLCIFSVPFVNGALLNLKNSYIFGLEYFTPFNIEKISAFLRSSLIYPKDVKTLEKEFLNDKNFLNISIVIHNDILIFIFLEKPQISTLDLQNVVNEKKFLRILRRKNLFVGANCTLEQLYTIKNFVRITYLFYYGFYNSTIAIKFYYNIVLNNVVLVCVLNNFKRSCVKVIFFSNYKFSIVSGIFKYFFFYKKKYFYFFTKFNQNFSSKNVINFLSILRSYFYEKGYFNFSINCFFIYPTINLNFLSIILNSTNGQRYILNSILAKTTCDFSINSIHDVFDNIFKENFYFNLQYIIDLRKFINYKLRDFFFFSNYTFTKILLNRYLYFLDLEIFIFCSKRVIINNLNLFNNVITKINTILNIFLNPYRILFLSNNIFFSNTLLRKKMYITSSKYLYSNNIEGLFISFKNLFLKITEKKLKSFSGNFSYNVSNGLIFTTAADLINFLGSEKNFKFFFEKNIFSKDYNFQYYDPFFFSHDVGFGFNFFYIQKDLSRILYKKFNYIINTEGCDLFFIIQFLSHKIITKFGYTKSFLNYSNKTIELKEGKFLCFEGCFFYDYYFSCDLEFNSFNKTWFSSSYFTHNLKVYLSLPFSDLKYIQFDYSFNFLKKIYYDFMLYISLNFCYKSQYGNTYSFPFFKNIYFKNFSIFKGFKDGTLNTRSLVNNNELNILYSKNNFFTSFRISLILPRKLFFELDKIKNFIFFDFGYFPANNLIDFPFKSSFGFATSLYGPFGVPIEFYITFPLFFCDTDRVQYFTISFANT